MHFIRTFLIMGAYDVKLIVIKKVQNYGKIVFIKIIIKNGLVGGCIPTSPLDLPLPAPITMSLTTMATSRFGFSMM